MLKFRKEGIDTFKPEKIRVGIFTSSYDKAKNILDIISLAHKGDIQFYRTARMSLNLRTIKDDIDYIWLRPSNSSRGYRCSRAYIQNGIDIEIMNDVVEPICIFCEDDDIIYFD